MKALIAPHDPVKIVTDWTVDGDSVEPVLQEIGYRVTQVAEEEFPVAEPLFWEDCPEGTTCWHYYEPTSKQFLEYPMDQPEKPSPAIPQDQPQSSGGIETL